MRTAIWNLPAEGSKDGCWVAGGHLQGSLAEVLGVSQTPALARPRVLSPSTAP